MYQTQQENERDSRQNPYWYDAALRAGHAINEALIYTGVQTAYLFKRGWDRSFGQTKTNLENLGRDAFDRVVWQRWQSLRPDGVTLFWEDEESFQDENITALKDFSLEEIMLNPDMVHTITSLNEWTLFKEIDEMDFGSNGSVKDAYKNNVLATTLLYITHVNGYLPASWIDPEIIKLDMFEYGQLWSNLEDEQKLPADLIWMALVHPDEEVNEWVVKNIPLEDGNLLNAAFAVAKSRSEHLLESLVVGQDAFYEEGHVASNIDTETQELWLENAKADPKALGNIWLHFLRIQPTADTE